MFNYIMNANSLKRSSLLFADSLSKGLAVPKRNFVRDMVLGILAAKSVQLASISRSMQESIDLKKTQERLSRNLASLSNAEYTHLLAKHALSLRPKFSTFTPIILDHTDIAKIWPRRWKVSAMSGMAAKSRLLTKAIASVKQLYLTTRLSCHTGLYRLVFLCSSEVYQYQQSSF